MPQHLTGPHAGKKACPLCVYGLGPQIQVWVEESKLDRAIPLIRELDALALRSPREPQNKRDGLTPYVVLAAQSGGKVADRTRRRLGELGLTRVFFVEVPSWDDAETSGLYGHSRKDRPDVRAYLVINRRLFRRWDNPSSLQKAQVAQALQEGRRFVTTYDRADAQIAPAWEPGQRMQVRFRLVDRAGRPVAKAKINAYETNREGLYNPRGWNRRLPVLATSAWTDSAGWVTFDAIMPGPYTTGDEPAHIHFSVSLGGKPHFRTLWFEGDALLTAERRAWADRDQETVVVRVDRTAKPWRVEHTFVLE